MWMYRVPPSANANQVEMLHYSKKLEELRTAKTTQKNLDEKMDRNKEKYAQASQALRDQTNQLMSIFAHAEQLRQRLLTQDLPNVIAAEKDAFDAFAVNLNKAATQAPDDAIMPRAPIIGQGSYRFVLFRRRLLPAT